MAQDAELKLKVSLDLGFFRQQLSTIGTQLSGQSVPIAIRFDKKAIADQYRLLDRYIRGKKFTVELNLVGGLTKNEFDKIKGRLDDLRDLRKVEIPIGIKNGATGKDVDKVVASIKERLAKNQQIKQGGNKLRIETSVKPSITNEDIANFKKAVKDKLSKIGALEIPTKLDVPKVEDLLKALQKNINRQKPLLVKTSIKPSILSADVRAFKKAVEDKLSGITVKINAELETIGGGKTKAQIEKEVLAGLERIQQMGAERMGGGVTEPARRESLRQSLQGRDIGEIKDIGKQLGVVGVGKFRNVQNLIERIVTEASIEMITKYLDPQAVMRNPDRSGLNKVLDTFARGLFNMLGMDVASMRQQMAQRRALPGVDFPATVPSRPVPIGPSGTGRALPPGVIPQALPGTAFGNQKYLPTNLGIELQQILRKAAYAFVDAVRQEVKTVKIGIGASMQAALPAARVAGLLPSAVGRTPSTYSTGAIGGESREQMMARRTAEAYARSALRGMDVMGGGAGRPPSPYSYAYRSARPTSAIIPYAQPGAIVPSPVSSEGGAVPPAGGGGSMRGMGGMGDFGRALGGVNLPGSGTIRELGEEFGFATKQVLLFGQAYKMLAFIQNFPAQVGAAVSQLQNFRNTLGAISPNAEEAASSNRLILDLVEKYNVPLQSARDGFTKLYASMAPAGFSGDEIRNLFTGITQAAATFGMSADKVDRVNYAFAQMASKGQVMSEELKGQLGDVLPGAMAIFAKAAGFEGPKAIQDFSAELEAGRYKGEAMVALLKNVGVVMRQEFGPGAEGAALTFQGIINRMQNSMTLLYESFEPVAVGFLNTVVVPLTDGIRQISDGFNAFFTGAAAKTSSGFGIAQELERLKPTFEGLGQNVKALIEQFGQFARAGLEVGKVLLQIAGNPFVGYLARVYAAVLPLTLAIQALNLKALIPLIASFVRAIPVFIAYTAATAQGATANKALQLAMVTTGKTAGVTATQIRTVGTAMKAAFTGTVIGAVLLGIGMLIEKIISLNASMADTKAKAMGAAQAIRSMSQTEAQQATRQYEAGAQSLKGLNDEIEQGKLKGKAWIEVTSQQAKALQDAGVIVSNVRGSLQVQPTRVTGAFQKLQGLAAEGRYRQEALSYEEKQAQQATSLAPIPAGGGEEKGNEKALRDAEQLAKQEQQRRIEQANFNNDMEKLGFDYKMQLSDEAFEHQKRLIDERNQYELSGLNDIQAHQLKFAQDLKKVRLDAEDAIRKAIQKTEEAQLNVTAAQRTAQAAGVADVPTSGAMVDKSVLRNWLISQGFGRTTGDFTNAGHQTPNHMLNAMDMGILGGSDADALRKTADMEKKLRATGAFGDQLFGPISDPYGHGAGKGGSNIHLHIPTPGGKFKMTSGLADLMGGKQSSAAFSMDTKMQKENFDLQKQYAQSANQISLQALEIERAIQLAKEQTATVIKTNINSLFPVEQQKLDIRLQQMRHNLLMQGMPQEYIDYEEKRTIATEKAAGMTKTMIAENVEARKTLEDYNQKIAKGIELLPSQKAEMGALNNQIKLNEQGLKDLAKAQEESNIKSLESAIATMKQADALKAMEEVSNRINDAVTGVTDTYKSMFKEIAMGGDSVEALKKAQQALADQFLTMVFDMAMKPVEESMKNTLGKMFGVPNEKEQREKTIASMEAQLAELQAHKVHLKNIDMNTGIAAGKPPVSSGVPAPPGQTAGTAALQTLPFNGQTGGMLQTLPFNGQTGGMYQNLPFPTQDTGFLSSIGINTEEMQASMSESVTAFSDQLGKFDASIADSTLAVDEAGTAMSKGGPAGKKWQESLGQVVGGLGLAAGSVMGIVAGINQIKEGGTSNVLGGIGMIASMAGSLLGGFSGLFGATGGGGGGNMGGAGYFDPMTGKGIAGPNFGLAKGGIMHGGFMPFKAFANGGIVTGPTMGLVGEGRYSEAVVPLPDGKSIPVQLGGSSSRGLLSGGSSKQQNASPILSMSFQTTKFGDKEYVDIDQLQAAMAETRKMAAKDGAMQGSQLALDKLRNSPTTRRGIGLR